MNSSFGLALLIFSISIVSPLNDLKCGRLSNGCELKSYYCSDYQNRSICHMYVCDRIDLNFRFDQTEMELIQNCSSSNPEVQEALNNVYFQLKKSSILDRSFDLLNNELFLTKRRNLSSDSNKILQYDFYVHDRMTFRYVKGFDITSTFKQRNNTIRMDFHYSNFDFYLNRSLIRSCDDIIKKNPNKYQYIFDSFWEECDDCLNDIRFYNCEYKTKICPLNVHFNNIQITNLRFFGIQNTFYKRNFPRFEQISNSSFSFYNDSSEIFSLDLINMQNIELNSDILNKYLFSKIVVLRLFGHIVSIEKGLFKSFKRLRVIHIDLLSIRKLMHREIDWIFDLNSDIDVSSNATKKCITLLTYFYYEQETQNLYMNFGDYFPDEDFCLYAKVPFEKYIFIDFLRPLEYTRFSCTFLWLIRYQKILFKFCYEQMSYSLLEIDDLLNKTILEKCDFNKRLILIYLVYNYKLINVSFILDLTIAIDHNSRLRKLHQIFSLITI